MDVTNRRKVMKKTLKSIVLLSALCGGALHASFEFRSPLSVQDRGYMHWLLAPADHAWWYDQMPSAKEHTDWNIHMWGAAYTRNASRAFFDDCACDHDKITRKTTSLSQLWFGQAVFRGENVFAGGTFAGDPNDPTVQATQVLVNSVNPFLAFARISPVFDYNETGANIGIDFARYVGNDDRYHIGGRFNIPFKIIEIEHDSACAQEETLGDVVATRIVTFDEGPDQDQVEYAYRYDFLSALAFDTVTTPTSIITTAPVLRYNDASTPVPGTIQLTGSRLTSTNAAQNDTDTPAAYITKTCGGAIPTPPFKKTPAEVLGGALPADGSGDVGATYYMKTGVDYAGNLALDRAMQGTLFVVPRSIPGGPAAGELLDAAEWIYTNITKIIEEDLLVSEPATTFFANNGIGFCGYERIVGIGDFATEVYGGVGHYDDWFVDGIFGLQFPTGKRRKNSNQIFYQPTGNNGHVEIKLELDAGWKPRPWFAFEIRPAFIYACQRVEKRAAPFKGATVVNIGPEMDVKVSWPYFVLRTDFSFFHPHNPDLGFSIGYEMFAKGQDRISFCETVATDLLGRPNQPLSECNYERNTNSFSNKLRGQIFYRWNYFEIFGGGTQMVSGRHIMKETEGNIGLAIYF